MRNGWIAIVALLLLVASCKEEVATPRDDGSHAYYPLAVGMEWDYMLDSIVLRPSVGGVVYDSVRLEAHEVLRDTLRDLAGNLWYRGERYDRRADSTEWRFSQTFLLRRDAQRAYRREDNLEFVKLVFPITTRQRWDGHVAFDANRFIEVAGQPISLFSEWDYRYTSVDAPDVVGLVSFDSVAVVQAVDFENLLSRRYAVEKYAAGTGLVYREMEIFETQCRTCCNGQTDICLDLPWRQKAEAGFIIKQWLVR